MSAMTKKSFLQLLGRASLCTGMGACDEAANWTAKQPTPRAAWEKCVRGDWMIWLAVRAGVDRRLWARAACACARQSLRFVQQGEDRPRLAIEARERWCDEPTEANEQASRSAAAAADAAAYAADGARSRSLRVSANRIRGVIPWKAVRAALDAREASNAASSNAR